MKLHETARVAENLMKSRVLTKQEVKEIGAELVRRYTALGSLEAPYIKISFAFITRSSN